MKVSLIQMNSGSNRETNSLNSMKWLSAALSDSPDVICLPERFLYWGDDNDSNPEDVCSDRIIEFKNFARLNHVNVVLGSLALKTDDPDKNTNTTLVINRTGDIIHRYDKIYMYDVMRDDLVLRESDSTIQGRALGLFELDGITMGVGICFDIRYPEYFRELVQRGAEVIFLPACFRKITGEVAWDVLTRARAIENQVYFCACAQTGEEGVKARCGNTRIVSYDGRIVQNLEKDEGIVTAELDLEQLRRFRKTFPVLEQIKNIR